MSAPIRQIELPELFDAFVRLSNLVYRRKTIHLKPEKSYCAKCNTAIAWAMLENNRKHPINWISGGALGNLVYSGEARAWHFLQKAELDAYRRLGGALAQSHFDTCPFAGEFRRRK